MIKYIFATAFLLFIASVANGQEHSNAKDERLSYSSVEDQLRIFDAFAFPDGIDHLVRATKKRMTYRNFGNVRISGSFTNGLMTFSKIALGQWFINTEYTSPLSDPDLFFVSYGTPDDMLKNQDLLEAFGPGFLNEFIRNLRTGSNCERASTMKGDVIEKTLVFIQLENGIEVGQEQAAADCYLRSFFYHAGLLGVDQFKEGAFVHATKRGVYGPHLSLTFVMSWMFNPTLKPGLSRQITIEKLRSAYK